MPLDFRRYLPKTKTSRRGIHYLCFAVIAGLVILAGIGWLNARQPCQTFDCLINRHPPATGCPSDDWECLAREQVRYAPPFVIDSAMDYLTSRGWFDTYHPLDSISRAKTVVTMVSHIAEAALYVVVYYRAGCDDNGWCSHHAGFVLRYTALGWEILDVPWLSLPPFAGGCIDSWDYHLHGIQRDNALYYGRINTNHGLCTNSYDRQVVRIDAATRRNYLVEQAFPITPVPPS